MWAKIWALIEIVRALFELWGEYKDQIELDQAKDRLKKQAERKRAIDDIEKAKTTDDLWDAQDRLVRNKP